MMRTRLIPTSLLALSLALAASTAVVAQDDSDLVPEVAYSTGSISGEIAGFVAPTEEFGAGGLIEARGVSVQGIPVQMDDPRVSGLLTIVGNGTGQAFGNGFASIESRTYRLENDGGAWAGYGSAIQAITEDEALMDMETAVLAGEGDYEGYTAFLLAEFVDDNRAFEIVVVGGEPAPAPDPVPAS